MFENFKEYYYVYDSFGNKQYNVQLIFDKLSETDKMSESELQAFKKVLCELGIEIDDNEPVDKYKDIVFCMLDANIKDSNGEFVEHPYDQLTVDQRRLYVLYYEERNPEHKEKMDRFTRDMPKGMGIDYNNKPHSYDDDNINIRFLVYTAPESEKELFFRTAEKVEVNWECDCGAYYGTDDDGVRRIHVDLTGYVTENGYKYSGIGADLRGAYTTLFHEYGHYVDDVIVDGKADGKGYISEQNNLTETIREEVANDIKNNLLNYCENESIYLEEGQPEIIVAAIVGPDIGEDRKAGWTDNMVKAYDGLIEAYNESGSSYHVDTWNAKESDRNAYVGVTDVYDGVTDMQIEWGYSHTKDQFPNFWYDENGKITSHVGKEFYANSFSHNFTRSPKEQLTNTERVLGDSLEEYYRINDSVK